MRRDKLEPIGQTHESALAWTDKLKHIFCIRAKMANQLIFTRLREFPAEYG
jgi:hypothetical protein